MIGVQRLPSARKLENAIDRAAELRDKFHAKVGPLALVAIERLFEIHLGARPHNRRHRRPRASSLETTSSTDEEFAPLAWYSTSRRRTSSSQAASMESLSASV